jgi:hypothetical protein
MKTRLIIFVFAGIFCFLISGCNSSSSPAVLATAPSSQTPFSPTATSLPPTLTPLPPTQTPTAVVFAPPAARFLPEIKDFSSEYAPETSVISENLAMQAQLPLPKENMGVAAFRNQGGRKASIAQDGVYYRFVYWVLVAPNEPGAQLFYTMSLSKEYAKQAFLVIMPAAVQEKMGDATPIPVEKSPCDQTFISAVVSDPYASYRNGKLPTAEPNAAGIKGWLSPEDIVKFPPDLYLYSGCRVKNVLVLFWGHAPNNYDGKNTPLPDDVVANQVINFWKVATQKLN